MEDESFLRRGTSDGLFGGILNTRSHMCLKLGSIGRARNVGTNSGGPAEH